MAWIYKDELEQEVKHVEISPRKYGKGYEFLRNMGYTGKGPIGTNKYALVEPMSHTDNHKFKDNIDVRFRQQRFHLCINTNERSIFDEVDSEEEEEDIFPMTYERLLRIQTKNISYQGELYLP